MQLSWSQILTTAAVISAVGCIVGYGVYFDYRRRNDAEYRRSLAAKARRKRKAENKDEGESKKPVENMEEKGEKTQETKPKENKADLNEGTPEELKQILEMCEMPIEQLMILPGEQKQQAFYGLLMRGEMLMNTGAMDQAVECFAKAVALVPAPGEVIMALERTLPPPVFGRFLERIQGDIQKKVKAYFKDLLAEKDSPVHFVAKEEKAVQDGIKAPLSWTIRAKKNIPMGTLLWEEAADIIVPVGKDESIHCENCLRPSGTEHACDQCQNTFYCSEACLIHSLEGVHGMLLCPALIEQGSPEAKEALSDLDEHVRKHGSPLPLLMLRYVAMLLGEELRGQGSAAGGPFAHYDHLPPVFVNATGMDGREAKILRTVFSSINANIPECTFSTCINLC